MALTFSRIVSTLIAALMLIGQAPSYAQNMQGTQPPPLSAAEIEQLVAPVLLTRRNSPGLYGRLVRRQRPMGIDGLAPP